MKQIKKIIASIMIMTLFNVPGIKVYAQTDLYDVNVWDAAEEIAYAIKLGETDVTIHHIEEDANLDQILELLFSPRGWSQFQIPEKIGMEYYALNVWQMSWVNSWYNADTELYETNISFWYHETPEETMWTVYQVNQILAENMNKLEKMSRADSYKWIYNYICKNVEYDPTQKYTSAYDALQYGKATCVGYASLYYMMAKYLELPCKIVTGLTDNTDQHAWNLGQVNGKWYCIDATWGDASQQSYLLRSKETMKRHQMDSVYEEGYMIPTNTVHEEVIFAKNNYKLK